MAPETVRYQRPSPASQTGQKAKTEKNRQIRPTTIRDRVTQILCLLRTIWAIRMARKSRTTIMAQALTR